MNAIVTSVISALISSTVAGLVIGFLLLRRTETIRRQVEMQFQRLSARRTWKERSVAELMGPVTIQLDRTQRAFGRWKDRNAFLETKVIREGNLAIRDLLLKSPHLIPADLFPHAAALIEHYDRWLEEYDRVRGSSEPDLNARFVFVGPEGYPFPQAAEREFKLRYAQMLEELFGKT